jgi:hypothetical protein
VLVEPPRLQGSRALPALLVVIKEDSAPAFVPGAGLPVTRRARDPPLAPIARPATLEFHPTTILDASHAALVPFSTRPQARASVVNRARIRLLDGRLARLAQTLVLLGTVMRVCLLGPAAFPAATTLSTRAPVRAVAIKHYYFSYDR